MQFSSLKYVHTDKDYCLFTYLLIYILSDWKYMNFRHLIIHGNIAIVFVFLQSIEAHWWIEIHVTNVCEGKSWSIRIIQCLLGEVQLQCFSEVQNSPGATEITVLTQVCIKYCCSDCNMVVTTLLGWQFPLHYKTLVFVFTTRLGELGYVSVFVRRKRVVT